MREAKPGLKPSLFKPQAITAQTPPREKGEKSEKSKGRSPEVVSSAASVRERWRPESLPCAEPHLCVLCGAGEPQHHLGKPGPRPRADD